MNQRSGQAAMGLTPTPIIEGQGHLMTVDRVDLGRVSYRLWEDDIGALPEGRGIIFADSDVIGHAFNSDGGVQLVRKIGKAIRIVVTNVIATNAAEFRVSGSPGPM